MSASGVPGFEALGQDINKVKPNGIETQEGIVSELLPELDIEKKDDDLVSLAEKWEKAWKNYAAQVKKRQDDNEKYYLGYVRNPLQESLSAEEKPNPDNVLFEAVETFLPIATHENPEPMVESDNTTEGNEVAYKVCKMLVHLARTQRMKLTLKKITFNWMLYFLGVGKVGWSGRDNEISFVSVRPQKLILDPNATIINGEYTGEYIGEKRKDKASDLIKRFPKAQDFITEACKGNLGTDLNYTEWWTDESVFWKLDKKILGKIRNPHWNYPEEAASVDEYGTPIKKTIPGSNHFSHPMKPYIFLSVFNLGLHPMDDTNLVHQNQKLQDMVNKRLRQIDVNADNTNGGVVVSGDFFTKEQASKVSQAARRGDAVWVPSGDVNTAFKRDQGPPLPAHVYQSLIDYRAEIKNNFGVAGSAPSGSRQEKTVRGKMLQKEHDISRIGGGVTEYIEALSELAFNWFVQLMYVYYDEPHTASVIGKERMQEFIMLRASDLNRRLTVTVKEGSLIPKDAVTQREEALNLWGAGALDPITLFERLEFPNPRESAKNLFLWKTSPQSLFPDLAAPAPAPGQLLPGQPPVA